MEFDRAKVYTSLTADVLKIGCIGYFADSLSELREQVEQDYTTSTLLDIGNEESYSRFGPSDAVHYNLFYLVELPVEKKFRPYKDTDEMYQDFLGKCGASLDLQSSLFIPNIWLQNKYTKEKELVTRFDTHYVYASTTWNLEDLFNNCTYLDGTPCGMEE